MKIQLEELDLSFNPLKKCDDGAIDFLANLKVLTLRRLKRNRRSFYNFRTIAPKNNTENVEALNNNTYANFIKNRETIRKRLGLSSTWKIPTDQNQFNSFK